MSTTVDPSSLSPLEKGDLMHLLKALRGPGQSIATLTTNGRTSIHLPASALSLITEVVEHLAAGRAVAVVGADEEVSPREAAELLGVSRPVASRLFDEGCFPSRRVGTHRRAAVREVLAYRDRQWAARRDALDELAAEGQRLDFGY